MNERIYEWKICEIIKNYKNKNKAQNFILFNFIFIFYSLIYMLYLSEKKFQQNLIKKMFLVSSDEK